MRLHLFFAALILLCSCEDDAASYSEIPPLLPYTSHIVSHDGTRIAYVWSHTGNPLQPPDGMRVLDLATGVQYDVDLGSALPPPMELVERHNVFAWCPYNNDRLLLYATTRTDTAGDGKSYRYERNLYVYSLSGGTVERVPHDPREIIGMGTVYRVQWLRGSSAEADSFLLSDRNIVYIPQAHSLVQFPWELSSNHMPLQSPDGQYFIWPVDDALIVFNEVKQLRINDRTISLSKPAYRITCAGWSPDSRKVLLTVYDMEHIRLRIAEVGRAIQENLATIPEEVIRLPLPSTRIHSATFLTDSTLLVALSLHKGDPVRLWEMTPQGKLLRSPATIP